MSRLGSYLVGGIAAAFSAGIITAVALGQSGNDGGSTATPGTNQAEATATSSVVSQNMELAETPASSSGDNRQPGGTPASSTQRATTASEDGLHEFSAGDAGTITVLVEGRQLTLHSVNANAGWTWREDDDDDRDEVEVDFFNGALKVEVEVEFDDGRLKHEVDTERRSTSGSCGDDDDDDDDDDDWDDCDDDDDWDDD